MKVFLHCFLLLTATYSIAQSTISRVLFITTTANTANNTLTLKWNKVSTATGYSVSKKQRNDTAWTSLIITPTNNDTIFTDTITNKSIGYEYQIVTRNASVTASGCVYAGINLPPQHYRGRLIVLIDSAYINYCKTEINQYLLDIIKEGWNYNVKYIGRNASVFQVKQIIKTLYEQDAANTKGIFILGHIAVPYSGDIYPDGHSDHYGAWPTDSYYADTSTSYWTDNVVNLSTASRQANRNIPGDGKFDQWQVNSLNAKFFVTRVDLFDMPAINNNDSLLTKNYLIKDHAYRALQNKFRMKALVDDNFGYFAGEAFSQNGYRNGGNLLGKDSVIDGDYFTSMNTPDKSYLWSFGCGAGTYTSAGGIGSTFNFQSNNVQSVFTMLFGSYFGDWDNTNNFLRAPLAGNNSILTSCWAGRPNWFFQGMGLGEPIGFSAFAQIKTPGKYVPSNYGSNFIHAELLGDPTLRMYIYEPPKNLTITNVAYPIVQLTWGASTEPGVTGYFVYRSNDTNKPFTLLNNNPVNSLVFYDSTAPAGKNYYMIRAVKLQNTVSSGTFFNLSAGIIDTITVQATLPAQLLSFSLSNNNCNVNLNWKTTQEENIQHYEVLFSTDGTQYNLLGKINPNSNKDYKLIHEQVCKSFKGNTLFYKLKIADKTGSYSYSNVLTTKIKDVRNITLYENPVTDNLRISGLSNNGNVRIINSAGNIMLEQRVKGENISVNVASLMPGFYVLQYSDQDEVYTTKFIKQ